MQKYLILILIIFSCGGAKNLMELSELTIEARTANKLIVNRKPDYGIDGRDGCVVMEEISMDIAELSENFINGKVFNSKTKEPLINAQLTLFLSQNDLAEKIIVASDSHGIFKSELNGQLNKIEVAYIAYRDLVIDLKK